MAIWYILWSFVIIFPVLVFCTEKNLATLVCQPLNFPPFYAVEFFCFCLLAYKFVISVGFTTPLGISGQHFLFIFSAFAASLLFCVAPTQGDQIGPCFAHWAVVYFWPLFKNHRSSHIFCSAFFLQ
jgi:hypothetical protein